MKHGLRNIILHHSYFSKIRCEILCDGHTNNSGKNGSGKTSALQLVPVFYGYPPERLVSREADKKSFLDYYLPHRHSMIIFEYRRESGICCAVLYRHPYKPKLLYRFVQGAADETLLADFTEEHFARGEATSELFKLLEKQGIRISRQIETISDYAAVISNDRDRFARQDKSLAYLARDFSLCRAGTRMRYMGDLTAVLLKSDQLLAQLRVMLASTLSEQNPIGAKPLLNAENRLPDTIRGLHALNRHKDKLREGVEQSNTLRAAYRELAQFRQMGFEFAETFVAEKHEYDAQIETLKAQWDDYQEQFQKQLSQLTTEKTEWDSEKKSYDQRLQALDARYREYHAQDMEYKAQEVAQLPIHERARVEAQKSFDRLQASQQELVKDHEKNCREIESAANEQAQNLQAQQDVARAAFDQAGKEKDRKLEDLDAAEKTAREQLEDSQQAELETYRQAVSDAQVLKAEAKLPTDEETIELESLAESIDAEETLKAEKQQARELADRHKQDMQRSFEAAKKHWAEARNYVQQQEEEARNIRALLYEDGTLLAFLRNSQGRHWQDIARVMHPPWLLRKDLQPQWDDDNGSIYGLRLDTAKLALPVEAEDTERLLIRLQEKEEAVSIAKAQLKDGEIAQGQADKAYCEAETAWKTATQQFGNAQTQLQALLAMRKEMQIKHKQAADEREKEAQARVEEAEAQLEAKKTAHKVEKAALSKRFDGQKTAVRDEFALARQTWEKTQEIFKNQLSAIQDQKDQDLEALKAAHQAALVNAGVDEKVLEAARTHLAAQKANVARIEKNRQAVLDYQLWLETQWPQRGEWQKQIDMLDESLSRVRVEIRQLKDRQQTEENAYRQKQQHITRALAEVTHKLEAWQRIKKQIEDLFLELEGFDSDKFDGLLEDASLKGMAFEVFIHLAEEKLAVQQKQVEGLRNAVKLAVEALQYGELAQVWATRMERYRHLMYNTAPYLLTAMHEIDEMLRHDIPQAERSNIENFRAIASLISEYYAKIEDFDRAVQRLSKEISAQINNEHGFPALSDIQITLTSALSEEALFRDLGAFHKRWRQNISLEQLPDDELLNAFSHAWHILASSHIDTAKPASLVHLTLSCKEQGRPFTLSHNSNLKNISSTGISTMLIVVLFASLTRHLCEDRETVIHWPLDELGRIDGQNTLHLFDFMDKQNIYLFCAQPGQDPQLAPLFACKNEIDRVAGIRRYELAELPDNPLLEADHG